MILEKDRLQGLIRLYKVNQYFRLNDKILETIDEDLLCIFEEW